MNKKKIQKDEERNKQKIFELKEITIPDNITVKDLAIELIDVHEKINSIH